MYRRQVLGALVLALLLGGVSFTSGVTLVGTVAVTVVSYLLSRWAWATVRRTQHWLPRGTKGVYREHCPNCRSRRYRRSGDWILKCHSCGWTAGRPVFRWLTSSVPAVQFQRSVSRKGAFTVGVFGTLLVVGHPFSVTAPQVTAPSTQVSISALPTAEQMAAAIALVLAVVLVVLWVLRPRQHFCADCGQDLGKGDPPATCPRCGCNRSTTEDPGVGKKVKVEHVE